jgi:hypothetical protein
VSDAEGPRPPARGRRRDVLLAGALLIAAGVGVGALVGPRAPSPSTPRYLNHAPGVGYVGVPTCRECHPAQHKSYAETPHSRAFRPVDPAAEPFPAVFEHEASGLVYEMRAEGGRLSIRESIAFEDGERVVLTEHPVHHVVGSGEFSLTYASELDGFLVESPTTWYAGTRSWAMSPGFDAAAHAGFGRVLSEDCLHCHVGRVEPEGGNPFRFSIHEEAIGCERCHGPGALHVERHRGKEGSPAWTTLGGGEDPTIVVPSDLPRDLEIDVCAQCHLDHLVVPRLGVAKEDWRPGLRLDDFRVAYRLAASEGRMTVVGHVDQMRQSRCFEASGTMTCLTCHDPHARPRPEDRDAWYRGRCLTCHQVEDCGEDPRHRATTTATDSCVACHMPRGDTDIPHIAFTHHRVGVHGPPRPPVPASGDRDMTLVEVAGARALPPLEAKRSLGLAYLQLAERPSDDPGRLLWSDAEREACFEKARALLSEAHAEGADDPEVIEGLAGLEWNAERRGRLAREVLAAGDEAPALSRIRALSHLVRIHFQAKSPRVAEAYLRELTRISRSASDWSSLADVAMQKGDREEARAATQAALRMEPSNPYVQERAAVVLGWLGDPAAALHQRIAERLRERHAAAR